MNKRFLSRSISAMLLAVSLGGALQRTVVSAQSDDPYAANEVVLKLKLASDLSGIQSAHQLMVIEQFGSRPIYRMRINDGIQPPAKAQVLLTDSRIQYAEPNFEFQAPESRARSRPGWVIGDGDTDDSEWAPAAMNLPQAHTVSRGAGVRVAVIDTGIETTHARFAGRLKSGYDFVDDDVNPSELGTTNNFGYGHGTHVAGLVAVTAPDAAIMPIRALDPDGKGNLWVLAEALAYAVDPDRNPGTDDGAHVINLSLGTTRQTSLLKEITGEITCENDDDDDDNENNNTRCRNFGGAVVIAAAGNSGSETMHYPAAESVAGLIAVGASTRQNTMASFSSFGSHVKLVAPGERIISSVPNGATAAWSGTSMAAPLTAGVAALLIAQDPGKKPADITGLLESKGSSLCNASAKLLNAAEALGLSTDTSPPCTVYAALVQGG